MLLLDEALPNGVRQKLERSIIVRKKTAQEEHNSHR